jgi:hypothetical protein
MMVNHGKDTSSILLEKQDSRTCKTIKTNFWASEFILSW